VKTDHSASDRGPLEDALGVSPDPALRERALTHRSYAYENGGLPTNERLEFLGDSVLELAVAHALYRRFPDFTEGRMAKIRSHVVSRASCAVVARDLDLGERLRENASGMPEDEIERLVRNRNVLAAVLEAALAALYLEHGFERIEDAVVAAFSPRIEYALTHHVDHKTELQELLARTGRSVSYSVVEVEGPPHDRTFTAAASVNGAEVGVGRGRSKKDAEQQAAMQALERLGAEADDTAPASAATG
jgi:ribonuclease III